MDVHGPISQQKHASDGEEGGKADHDADGNGFPVLVEGETGEDVVAAVGYAIGVRTGVAGRTVVETIREFVRCQRSECKVLGEQ